MTRVEILAAENGPNVVLVDGKPAVALCRCGLSRKKPLCDGSHHQAEFHAAKTTLSVIA